MPSSKRNITWNGYQVSAEENAVLKQHGIDQLASYLPTAGFSHSSMPIFFYFAFADYVEGMTFGIWLGLSLLFAVVSGALFLLYRNNSQSFTHQQWYNLISLHFLIRSTLLSSIVLFIPMEIYSYTYIIIFMLTVFIAVGVITLSRHTTPFLLYILPMLAFPAAAIITHWDGELRLVALAYVALIIPAYIAFRSTSHTSAGNILIKLRNDTLNNKLAIEKEQAELARDVALKANTSKSRFFAAANHDLRQPLYALSLLSRQLRKNEVTEETQLLHEQIESSIDLLCTMLDSLLDVSQLDSKKITPEITTFELSEIFFRIESEFSVLAKDKGIEFHTTKTSACTSSDHVQLERMIRNVVHNAIKYTNRGKVILGVRHRPTHYEIQVIDTGPGINKDDLTHIFDEFYQIENSERDRENGVGLGLSIVKRLSLLLNHEVSINSSPGRGICFSIFVPKTQCVNRHSILANTPTFDLKRTIALIIDDDKSILQGLGALFEEWNATVFLADSGKAATLTLDREGILPDILICDYRLRNNEIGTDVISQIRDMLEYPVPAIILTADPLATINTQTNLTDIELIQKPAVPEHLFQTIYDLTHEP